MAKTFIQLINDVGKHMRRSDGTDYTSVTQDADVVFIASALNIAKDMVEGEARWESMLTDITFPSAVGVQTYDTSVLTVVSSDPDVTNERSQIITAPTGQIQFWDITDSNEFRMKRRSRSWVHHRRQVDDGIAVSEPLEFAIYPLGDGLTVEFPFDIDSVRTYSFQVYNPQDELDTTTTVILCPWRPVVLAATALVAEERGEELGMEASTWWGRYNSALSQALVVDMWSAEDATLVAT